MHISLVSYRRSAVFPTILPRGLSKRTLKEETRDGDWLVRKKGCFLTQLMCWPEAVQHSIGQDITTVSGLAPIYQFWHRGGAGYFGYFGDSEKSPTTETLNGDKVEYAQMV